MGRRPSSEAAVAVAPAQLAHVMEILRQAEAVVESLGEQTLRDRGVVRLPRTGYPLRLIERDALVQALSLTGWVQAAAAPLLGITPRVMNYKVQQHRIHVPPGTRARRWPAQSTKNPAVE